jgi:hypothetical protein
LPVYQTSSGPRLPYFLEKVSDTSFPRLPVFWGILQDRFRSDFSPQRKNFSHFERLENPSKNLWCNRQAKLGNQKLVNLVVPDKTEKFPGSQRNWDMFDSEILSRHTCLFISGFLISWKKSQILPSQDFLFLGQHYRTEEKFQLKLHL